MRLINIHTLELEEFFENDIPPYFILSHRWEGKETSFADFVNKRESAGYRKIVEFCQISRRHQTTFLKYPYRHHINWAWVDTCMAAKTQMTLA
jgi:hypothetical protein